MAKPKIKNDGKTITVRVPIAIRKRGGRKVVQAPDGMQHDPSTLRCQQVDNAMVKAIARGFRWREMLERGDYATVKELARTERINHSYVARVLRLTLLAPDIVQAVLEARHCSRLTLQALLQPFDPLWQVQLPALLSRELVCCDETEENRIDSANT